MHWEFDYFCLEGSEWQFPCAVYVLNIWPVEFWLVIVNLRASGSEESLSGQAEWRLDMKKGLSMKASGAQ